MFAIAMKLLPLFLSAEQIDHVMFAVKVIVTLQHVFFPQPATFVERWGNMGLVQEYTCVEHEQILQCVELRVMFDSQPILDR